MACKHLHKFPSVRELGAILGIKDQSRNKYSYWILDVTQEMIVAAQRRGMDKTNQVRTLNWFLFILKQMQCKIINTYLIQ